MYPAYADDALTGFLAHHGLGYRELMAAGFVVQLVHVELNWTGALRWGDDAGVAVRVARTGTTSFTLAFEVRRAGEPVATAEVVYVCVATDGSGERPLPPCSAAAWG